MLLQSIKVTNSQGSILNLPLSDVSGGFVVKEIEGLGPVKATIASSSYANMDGAQYHSARREPRNLVFKLGLDPNYSQQSVYDLRNQLYDFFMTKTACKLEFHLFDKFSDGFLAQNLNVEIEGRVESVEPDMFSREPTIDLSIMCFKPDFIDPELIIFEGFSTDGLDEVTIDYKGTVESGVIFRMNPARQVPGLTIYHRLPDGSLRTTELMHYLENGDLLAISSIRGSKYVTLNRTGVESSILYSLLPQSNWLQLMPGENYIRVYAEGSVPVPFSIEYTNKYGGL